jgi:hypothetical protein
MFVCRGEDLFLNASCSQDLCKKNHTLEQSQVIKGNAPFSERGEFSILHARKSDTAAYAKVPFRLDAVH